MPQRRHEPSRIDLEKQVWLLVRIDLDVLVWYLLDFERYPNTLHEGTVSRTEVSRDLTSLEVEPQVLMEGAHQKQLPYSFRSFSLE